MKTLRKAISLTLMLALVLTSVLTTSVFAATTFTDVDETTQFNEAIYELVDDGVINGYEDGTFKPEGTITRAEFAKVIGVAIAGSTAMWDAKEIKFGDMSGHWAIPYVAYASNAGIINGYEDNTFRPDQPVTYAEAVKMIVCALGYGPVVDTTLNPWYTGYITVGNQIGLTKNAATLADNGASRGLVAQLISNMKNCKRLVQTGTDASGKPTFSTSDKDIINSDEEYEEEGVVIGVYDNTLRGSEISLTKSQINIDGETYTLSDDLKNRDNLAEFLGKRVDFVYEGSSKYTVTSIKIAGTNDVEEISVDQFDSISGNEIYYYENPDKDTKTKSLKLDDDIYIVYNGFGVPSDDITDEFIEEAFNIETGIITFYNNDSDSYMDVAFIENYKTYFLNSTPTKNNGVYTIIDKNNFEGQIKVDEDDASVYRVTTAGGTPSAGSMTNLTSKSVVSIATPLNRTSGTTIMVSSATVSGSIASMDSDYEEIEISSKTYKVAPYFRRLLEKDAATYGFDVGSNVKLYLDYLGRIVSSEISVSSDPYGYLLDYAVIGDSFDGDVHLKIYTDSRKWVEYPLRDTVRINGESFDQSDVPDELKKSAARINLSKRESFIENADVAQLIKFKTATSDGKTVISEISTIGAVEGEGEITKETDTDCATTLKYNKTGNNFVDASGDTVFSMKSSTIIFSVPKDRDAGDKEYNKLSSSSAFSDGDEVFVEAYNFSENSKVAEVVVYYPTGKVGGNIQANTETRIIINKRTSTSKGYDGFEFTLLTMGKNDIDNDAIILYTSDDYTSEQNEEINNLKVGDLIKCAVTDDVIDNFKAIYTDGELVNATDNYLAETWNRNTEYYQVMVGTITEKYFEDDGAGNVTIAPNFAVEGEDGTYTIDKSSSKTFSVGSSASYYKLDKNSRTGNNEVAISSYAELRSPAENGNEGASQVIIVAYDSKVKAIYIIGPEVAE